MVCGISSAMAQNPIICDRYTPDPAPYVHGDTLYLFVDHDEQEDIGYFNMKDWLLYSTVDMVNWTYRGTPVTTKTFKWAKQGNDAWASQCIERNGKWYWYVTATVANGGYPGIGVAVANKPEGPYRDPIGKPVVQGWGFIDPSVFIDDDGQAYLFWGNNGLWYAKLSRTMTSISGGQIEVKSNDESAFGPSTKFDDNGNKKTNFEEASWIYKIGDTYYLEYAAGGVPEHMAYSTAKSIKGPWTYQGKIMGTADGSFTIHGGSVNFKGHNYMFYHNGKLPGGGGFRRSTCIEEFTRKEDGSIPFINFTTKGVNPIQTLNPYELQEAETINQSSGILCEGDGTTNYVTNIDNSGDYIKVRNIDFGELGASKIKVRVASGASRNVKMLVRLTSKSGKILGTITIAPTGGEFEWTDLEVDLSAKVTGVHDIVFAFSGVSSIASFNFDNWQFTEYADAIESIKADEMPKSAVFDLDGTKIANSLDEVTGHKRIVISNGKKYFIK